MKDLQQLDELSRRDFAAVLAKYFLGVGLLSNWKSAKAAALAGASSEGTFGTGRARNVIYLYMNGGMSHLDTFDPKPGAETQGRVEAISTNAGGVLVSQFFPRMARQMDKAAVIRSMTSTQGAHERGRYLMRTGYTQRGTILHPALGAWVLKLSGAANHTLPANVRIGGASQHPGAGFMESRYAPLPIGNPNSGLQNSRLPGNVSSSDMQRRLSIADRIDASFREQYDLKKVRAYTDAYSDAVRLMNSRQLDVFDLTREPQWIRDAYGSDAFGQGCLLARRLVENEVRFVEVAFGGWDTHQDNFERVEARSAVLDRALSSLLSDLESRGLLEETLVVLATEFGRTPKINQNNGRDHYPKAFTCLLAGGGVRGGQAYGRTSKDGSEVEENPAAIQDFNATIAAALGLPLDKEIYSPSGRPFTVANKGKPLAGLLA